MRRRQFVGALAAVPFFAWAGSLLEGSALGRTRLMQFPGQNPDQFPGEAPPRPAWPNGASPFPPPIKVNRHAILLQNQKNIRKDVSRLYDLAGKLRKQVDHTDSTEVLSVNMIHTADEIEKLAKHIKNLAKN